MTAPRPRVAVFAGINGAGKSTASRRVLVDVLGIRSFVNADAIARGLNGIDPESVAFHAGRVMVEYLDVLAKKRADIALETTLTARTYASWFTKRRDEGYAVYLYYFWLRDADLAIERVAKRVAAGGTTSPRRRFAGVTRTRSKTFSSCTNRSAPSGSSTITVSKVSQPSSPD